MFAARSRVVIITRQGRRALKLKAATGELIGFVAPLPTGRFHALRCEHDELVSAGLFDNQDRAVQALAQPERSP